MPRISKDKQVKYTLDLNQEEMKAVSIALAYMYDKMKREQLSKCKKEIMRPGICESVLLEAQKKDIENVSNHIAHIIEED